MPVHDSGRVSLAPGDGIIRLGLSAALLESRKAVQSLSSNPQLANESPPLAVRVTLESEKPPNDRPSDGAVSGTLARMRRNDRRPAPGARSVWLEPSIHLVQRRGFE